MLEAPDGPSGLTLLGSSASLDLQITGVDLTGDMTGRPLKDAALTSRSERPMPFVTGYANDDAVGNGHLGWNAGS